MVDRGGFRRGAVVVQRAPIAAFQDEGELGQQRTPPESGDFVSFFQYSSVPCSATARWLSKTV